MTDVLGPPAYRADRPGRGLHTLGLITGTTAGVILAFQLIVLVAADYFMRTPFAVFLLFAVVSFVSFAAAGVRVQEAQAAHGPPSVASSVEPPSLSPPAAELWLRRCAMAGKKKGHRCIREPGHAGRHRMGTLEDAESGRGGP